MDAGLEREIDDLRQGFKRFASKYPQVAGSLDLLDKNGSTDPDIRYLIEAFCCMTRDLSCQIERGKYRHLDAILNSSECLWSEPVPPSTVVALELMSYNAEKWPVTLDAGLQFVSEANVPLKLFNKTEVWPWEVVGARYVRGSDYNLDHPVMLELEIKANAHKVWNVGRDINIYVSAKSTQGLCLISGILVAGIAFYADQEGVHEFAPDIETEMGLMDYVCHPGDARLRELLFFTEKYFFLKARIDKWSGDTLKLIYPIQLQSDLPALEYMNFHINCAPATAIEKRLIDPIRYDGTKSVYPVIPPSGWEVCKVDSITVDDKKLDDVAIYRVGDHLELSVEDLSIGSVLYGDMHIMPQEPISVGRRFECTQYPAFSTTLYSCTRIVKPTEKTLISAYAIDIGGYGAAAQRLLQHIIDTCSAITTNWVVGYIKSIKCIDQEFTPFLTDRGWCNGVTVTISVPTVETVLVARILLCIMRHRAPINTAIGLRVVDEDGTEIVHWKACIE